ncbi:methyl-accepting chemotaxis protein [Pseudomonas plecoglossicida]|uniref:Methyl-accepting chemotaxis transducer n=2 Tax=Pseudomonas TaxID=286 RepID=A0A2L1KF41_PSEAI|nr:MULTISPECIES: methyl-accepting chemotaxis protein [Pseudomonas]MEE1902972.1 methyl-accepting chemotaxis protein [Pseudomonas inefficax]AGA73648.1 methyl-accepting chemotaxis transducer [Pseudomonas putida HB3267]AVE20948.1 Methyl-accepting chemotaxis transducer [Pseudomonas aeruginosa]MBF8707350.1 methyl-accepting chemotaxis protein [Pseudomonas putida]MCE0752491.1 methyl-accepting chemotaxis protein [Pseudomonas asiatica]
MFKKISLTLKLFLPPAIALFGLLLFVGYTAVQLDDNDSRLVSLEKQRYPTLEAADNVIFQFSRLPGLLNSAVAAGERDTLDEASDVLADVHARLRDLEPLTAERADRHRELQAWSAAIKRYADNALASSGQLLDGAAFDDLRPHFDRMASDLKNAQALGEQFRSHAYADFLSSLTQVRADNATTTHVGYLLSFCLLLLVSASAAWVIRQVMGNVRGVIASLRTIASGDGDLTRRVHVDSSDEIGEMIGLFNGLLDSLQGTLRQVIETAAPLEQMSRELHRLTQGAEDSARSQQERTESISSDIDTMTNSIQEVAQRSGQASEQASAAARQANEARHNIDILSSSIGDLGNSVLGSVQAMEQLEAETQHVGAVLTVIRSIAEQTNLLALNAAIEAARAGEQGRGFAVVADEVRNLAQKTAASIAQIQDIIQRLQSSASGVLHAMNLNGEKARTSIERSEHATQTLEAITKTVRQIDELNAGIARFTNEQIGLSRSIQQDTEKLQQDTQATTQGADATARLGEQLVGMGNHLRSATAQFRI